MRSWKEFGNTPGRRIYLHRFLEVDIHTASGNVNYRISHKFCLHSPPSPTPQSLQSVHCKWTSKHSTLWV